MWTQRYRSRGARRCVAALGFVVLLFHGFGCAAPGEEGTGEERGATIVLPESGRLDMDFFPFEPWRDVRAAVREEMLAQAIPGVAMVVVEGGKKTFAMGLGVKERGVKGTVSPRTLFRIGEVTSVLTTIGALQQAEQKKLGLLYPITRYVPWFDPPLDRGSTRQIQVLDLMTGRSGMRDVFQYRASEYPVGVDPDQLLGVFYDMLPRTYQLAPPRAMTNPSRSGPILLGLITQITSHTVFEHYLRQEVLDPLGMYRTTLVPEDVLFDGDFAVGHWDALKVRPGDYHQAWTWPAMGGHSSAEDLANLIAFLQTGDRSVLNDYFRYLLFTSIFETHEMGGLVWQGLGMQVTKGHRMGDRFYGIDVARLRGTYRGFSAEILYVPQCDLGMVWLANRDDTAPIRSLNAVLRARCDLPRPTAIPSEALPDPAGFGEYLGNYYERQMFKTMKVIKIADRLILHLPDFGWKPTVALVPIWRDTFRFTLVTIFGRMIFYVTFIRDADGKVTYIRNPDFVAIRRE